MLDKSTSKYKFQVEYRRSFLSYRTLGNWLNYDFCVFIFDKIWQTKCTLGNLLFHEHIIEAIEHNRDANHKVKNSENEVKDRMRIMMSKELPTFVFEMTFVFAS